MIDAEVSDGRQPSAEAYLEELLQEAHTRRMDQELFERLVDEGINSGPPIPVNQEFWAERRRKLEGSLAKTSQ